MLLALEGSIPDLQKQVEAVGKLKLKTDIPVKYFSKNRMKKYIADLVEKEYTLEQAAKDELFIRLMGFSSRKLNLKEIRKTIFVGNAGGFYNEKTKELAVSEDYRNVHLINSMIIAHELRHAIQDAHFNLSDMLGKYSYYDDRELAILSAVEGDAALVMVLVNGFSPEAISSTLSSDPLISFSPIGNTAQLYRMPDIIKHQFTMPYIYGLRFATSILAKKKWKGVNKLLKSPPESTEQVLHPEKYFKKEKPVPVTIDYKPRGYDLHHTGVIGEYYLNILLKPRDNYIDYAYGWGGDIFHIYRKDSAYFLVWKSVWDEEKFCSKFYFDFKRFIEKKFRVNFKKGTVKGSLFIAGRAGDDYFFIRRINDRFIYARSNDRDEMNKYIYGGNYD
jgi:hypothetical protein